MSSNNTSTVFFDNQGVSFRVRQEFPPVVHRPTTVAPAATERTNISTPNIVTNTKKVYSN